MENSKRRKKCRIAAAPRDSLNVADLPGETLGSVAAHLSRTERFLFAAALTAPSSSWERCGWEAAPSRAGVHIAEADRHLRGRMKGEVLNFEDIEESVRRKLNDGDIGAVLVCAKADTRLKHLKLPHCVNMRGHGLAPLRGSAVLETVDLSTVANEKAAISEESLLPILESIISNNQSSLKRLRLPKKWCARRSDYLITFLRESCRCYWEDVREGQPECSQCESSFLNLRWPPSLLRPIPPGVRDGVRVESESEGCALACDGCWNKYCQQDSSGDHSFCLRKCTICAKLACIECEGFRCDSCDRESCGVCIEEIICKNGCCGYHYCEDCVFNTDSTDIFQCTRCGHDFCTDCLREEDHVCNNCEEEGRQD